MTKIQAICLIGLIIAAGIVCLVIDGINDRQEVEPPPKFTEVPYVTTSWAGSWTKEAFLPSFEVKDIVR